MSAILQGVCKIILPYMDGAVERKRERKGERERERER